MGTHPWIMAVILRSAKRLAAEILKCGKRRVWIDPTQGHEFHVATRVATKKLITEGVISKKPCVSRSRFRFHRRLTQIRKGRHQGAGRNRGCRNARVNLRRIWMLRQRSLRRVLKKYRHEDK